MHAGLQYQRLCAAPVQTAAVWAVWARVRCRVRPGRSWRAKQQMFATTPCEKHGAQSGASMCGLTGMSAGTGYSARRMRVAKSWSWWLKG